MMKERSVTIIAEAGVNHNGDIGNAFKLIDVAAEAGADFVKFQSFKADKLVSKDAPKAEYQIKNTGADESQYEMLKRLELSEDDHAKLIEYCNKKNIGFLSTSFDVDGLHMLVEQFNVSMVKLGSSELTNAPILLAAAKTGLPIILSTGMGTLEDIEDALGALAYGYVGNDNRPTSEAFKVALKSPEAIAKLKEKVTILHCTTAYPTSYGDVNLSAMDAIKEAFSIPVGYSDHTMGIEIPMAAAAMGVSVIEKHFTLDRSMEGPDHGASLEPDELKAMVRGIRNIEAAIGNGEKMPSESEKINMFMARKSIVAAHNITKGEVLSDDNLTIKRPANGRSPMEYWEVLGKVATRSYDKDECID